MTWQPFNSFNIDFTFRDEKYKSEKRIENVA